MANTIRIKRRASSNSPGAPSGLANAELAYNEADNILYYGFGSTGSGIAAVQVIAIAGSGAYLNKNNNLSDLNNLQTTRNNLASNTVTSGLFMRGNGTNVLMGSIIPSDIPTLNQNTTGSAGSVTSSLTINNGGAGDNSGSTFNGSSAKTISYNSIGSPSAGGANATGTWNISVTGNAGTVTNGVYTTGNQSIGGEKTFTGNVYVKDFVQFKGSGNNSLDLAHDGGTAGIRTDIIGQNPGGWKNKHLVIENGTVGDVSIDSNFGQVVLLGTSGVAISAGAASSGTHFAAFVDHSSTSVAGYPGGVIKTRTAAQVKSDIGLSNVENLALSGVTFTAGSGLASGGGGTLAANRTFDVGQGDGITVSADAIAVDSTVVRTTGTQSIGGVKTFTSKPSFNDGLLVGGINRFSVGGGGFGFQIDRGFTADFEGDALKFDVDNDYGSGYSTTLKTYGPTQNIIIRLPTDSGVLARLQDITTTNITGTLAVNKGGTGATTLTSNNILVGNGTSAISAPYSVETTLTGGASAIPRADAVKTYVDSAIISGFATNDAMVFKGTLGSGGTVTALPTGTVSAGWSYRVITTGTYAGVVSEIGDLIIAVADANGNVNSTWTVVQTNLDGAVVGPASATDNRFALFNGTTGKIIKDAGFAATTVGQNLISLTNPGAISFLRINTNNTIDALSDVNFRTAIGAGTSSTVGTVTSVAALTLSTTGTDVSSTVATNTTTPVITLSIPTASASVRGALSSTDWTTFNNKAAANQTMFIGTTSVAINRSSAALVLTGITSIDGNAATVTNGVYTTGDQTIAGVKTLSNRPVLNSGLTVQASAAGSAGTYFPVFTADPGTSAQILTTRTASNLKTDLSLNNVENTALSTWAGSTSITTLGTIATGTWNATTIAVNKGGTGQTSYINGELLIGNTSTSGLAKATLTQGSNVTITNGNGSITIASTDTNTATAADDILDGSNTGTQITYAPYATNQAASASPRFYNTSDNPSGSGRLNVSAYFYATRLFDNGSRVVTASTICSDAGNCTWDGGDF